MNSQTLLLERQIELVAEAIAGFEILRYLAELESSDACLRTLGLEHTKTIQRLLAHRAQLENIQRTAIEELQSFDVPLMLPPSRQSCLGFA